MVNIAEENRIKINELVSNNNKLVAEIQRLTTTLETVTSEVTLMKQLNEAEKAGMAKAKQEMENTKQEPVEPTTEPAPTPAPATETAPEPAPVPTPAPTTEPTPTPEATTPAEK